MKGLFYTDKNVVTGVTYEYTVRAESSKWGGKTYSKYASAKKAVAVLGKTRVTAKAAGYGKVALSWKKVSGADGYVVYRADSAKGTYKAVKTLKGNGATSFTDSGLKAKKTYYYKVRAYRNLKGGKVYYGPYSDAKAVKAGDKSTAQKKFEAGRPLVRAKSLSYRAIRVNWSAYKDADQYVVYRRSGRGGWKRLAVVGSRGRSYVDKTVQTGVTYYYTVKAQSYKWGGVTNSKYVSGVKAKAVPGKPVISSLKNSRGRKAVLRWKKVDGATGYQVYRALGNGRYQLVKTITSGSRLSFTDKNLKKKGRYSYVVRAYRTVSGKKVTGSFSSAKSVKIKK